MSKLDYWIGQCECSAPATCAHAELAALRAQTESNLNAARQWMARAEQTVTERDALRAEVAKLRADILSTAEIVRCAERVAAGVSVVDPAKGLFQFDADGATLIAMFEAVRSRATGAGS